MISPVSTIKASFKPENGGPDGSQVNNVKVSPTLMNPLTKPQTKSLSTATAGVTGEVSNNDHSNVFATSVDGHLGSGGKGTTAKTTNSPTTSPHQPDKDPNNPNIPGNNHSTDSLPSFSSISKPPKSSGGGNSNGADHRKDNDQTFRNGPSARTTSSTQIPSPATTMRGKDGGDPGKSNAGGRTDKFPPERNNTASSSSASTTIRSKPPLLPVDGPGKGNGGGSTSTTRLALSTNVSSSQGNKDGNTFKDGPPARTTASSSTSPPVIPTGKSEGGKSGKGNDGSGQGKGNGGFGQFTGTTGSFPTGIHGGDGDGNDSGHGTHFSSPTSSTTHKPQGRPLPTLPHSLSIGIGSPGTKNDPPSRTTTSPSATPTGNKNGGNSWKGNGNGGKGKGNGGGDDDGNGNENGTHFSSATSTERNPILRLPTHMSLPTLTKPDNGNGRTTFTGAPPSATTNGSENGGGKSGKGNGGGHTDKSPPQRPDKSSPTLSTTTISKSTPSPTKDPNVPLTPSPSSTKAGNNGNTATDHHQGGKGGNQPHHTIASPPPPITTTSNTPPSIDPNPTPLSATKAGTGKGSKPSHVHTSNFGEEPVVPTLEPQHNSESGVASSPNNPHVKATDVSVNSGSFYRSPIATITSAAATRSLPSILNNAAVTSEATSKDGKNLGVAAHGTSRFSAGDLATTTRNGDAPTPPPDVITTTSGSYVKTLVPTQTTVLTSDGSKLTSTLYSIFVPSATSIIDSNSSSNLLRKPGVMAAIVISSLVALILIALLLCICIRRSNIARRRRERPYMFADQHRYSPLAPQSASASSNPFSKYTLAHLRTASIASSGSRSTLPPYPASERSSIVSTEKNMVGYGNEPERMKDLNIQRSRMQELIDAMRMRPESQEVWEAI